MKILVATTWFPNVVDPTAGAFIAKDVAALVTHHDVTVVHLVAPRLHDGGPARIVQTLEYPGMAPQQVRVLRVVMNPQRPDHLLRGRRILLAAAKHADLVHTMAFSTLLPFALGRRPRRPWVHTEHWQGVTARWHLPLSWRVLMPVLVRALLRPDVVTAVSGYATEPIVALRGQRETAVVPCIAFAPENVPARAVRTGDSLRLVAVGGLGSMKDPILAVRTIAELRERGVDASLTWVGEGPLRAAMTIEVTALGLDAHIRLVGSLDAAGVSRELSGCDIFFLPTKRETFGVAIAEALTHGRPVVVGANGAQGEYIDSRVGELVRTQEPSAYADAILSLDARTRTTPAAQVQGTVREKFTPETVLAGYQRAYAQGQKLRTARGTRI